MPAICLALPDIRPTRPTQTTWPTPEWHAELKRQATTVAIEAALRSARVEIDRLRRLGGVVELEAEDLVQDVLATTCAGSLKWCPEVVPLLVHVRDKVRLACRRQRRRNWVRPAAPTIALDAVSDEHAAWSEVEDVLAADVVVPDVGVVDVGRRFEADLRQLVAKDEVALRVLDQLKEGVTGNADVAAATGLAAPVVEGARKRLQRMARRVSPELLEEISASL